MTQAPREEDTARLRQTDMASCISRVPRPLRSPQSHQTDWAKHATSSSGNRRPRVLRGVFACVLYVPVTRFFCFSRTFLLSSRKRSYFQRLFPRCVISAERENARTARSSGVDDVEALATR